MFRLLFLSILVLSFLVIFFQKFYNTQLIKNSSFFGGFIIYIFDGLGFVFDIFDGIFLQPLSNQIFEAKQHTTKSCFNRNICRERNFESSCSSFYHCKGKYTWCINQWSTPVWKIMLLFFVCLFPQASRFWISQKYQSCFLL